MTDQSRQNPFRASLGPNQLDVNSGPCAVLRAAAVRDGRSFASIVMRRIDVLGRPGSDLLFQALRLSTIGAREFNGRVRDGIGFRLPAMTTRPAKDGRRKPNNGQWINISAAVSDFPASRSFAPLRH